MMKHRESSTTRATGKTRYTTRLQSSRGETTEQIDILEAPDILEIALGNLEQIEITGYIFMRV